MLAAREEAFGELPPELPRGALQLLCLRWAPVSPVCWVLQEPRGGASCAAARTCRRASPRSGSCQHWLRD